MNISDWVISNRLGFALLLTPFWALAHPSGAPIGSTGAPGSPAASCAQIGCHVGPGNPFNEGITIDFGTSGATYTPGAGMQTWTMTLPVARLYGFQMTARLASDERNSPAGTFTATGAGQAVLCADGEFKPASGCNAATPIEYLGHQDFASETNVITIQWTPPATDVGDVKIYVATNSANGNGQPSGDRITAQNFTLKAAAPAQPPAIRSSSPYSRRFPAKQQ